MKNVAADVDFAANIQPLLERSCVGCHAGEGAEGNLQMTTRSPLLRGGDSGIPALVPGESESSLLYLAAVGTEEGLHMPPLDAREKYPALHPEELRLLKTWIDQGATWPDGRRLAAPAY